MARSTFFLFQLLVIQSQAVLCSQPSWTKSEERNLEAADIVSVGLADVERTYPGLFAELGRYFWIRSHWCTGLGHQERGSRTTSCMEFRLGRTRKIGGRKDQCRSRWYVRQQQEKKQKHKYGQERGHSFAFERHVITGKWRTYVFGDTPFSKCPDVLAV